MNLAYFREFIWFTQMVISKGFVKQKQVKISDRKEQRYGDIVTPFSSSNAKR